MFADHNVISGILVAIRHPMMVHSLALGTMSSADSVFEKVDAGAHAPFLLAISAFTSFNILAGRVTRPS